MTTKAEKTLSAALDQLARLETSKGKLEVQSASAKADLLSFRKVSAQELIDGKDSGKVAGALATRESKAGMFTAALAEVSTQITAQQAIVAEAEKVVSDEASTETARQIRASALKMIEKMGALQVDLYRLEIQQRHMPRSPILDFNGAADRLAAVQEILENDEMIVSRSKVPRGRRIGGFIDDTHTVSSLGSAVRDWARQEVTG